MAAFSGGRSRLDALLMILCFVLVCVTVSPELQGIVLNNFPVLEPVFRWLHNR